jgi:hypothetical protein
MLYYRSVQVMRSLFSDPLGVTGAEEMGQGRAPSDKRSYVNLFLT